VEEMVFSFMIPEASLPCSWKRIF